CQYRFITSWQHFWRNGRYLFFRNIRLVQFLTLISHKQTDEQHSCCCTSPYTPCQPSLSKLRTFVNDTAPYFIFDDLCLILLHFRRPFLEFVGIPTFQKLFFLRRTFARNISFD